MPMKLQHYEVRLYETPEGSKPFALWLRSLRDDSIRLRIDRRLERLMNGNFGDCKLLTATGGVYELRFSFGPGYRVYFGVSEQTAVLLLCGGDKSSQDRDIRKATAYWNEYRHRRIQ
jgi:putative addiction module killer protein